MTREEVQIALRKIDKLLELADAMKEDLDNLIRRNDALIEQARAHLQAQIDVQREKRVKGKEQSRRKLLEGALALSEQLRDPVTGYFIERALDEARARQFRLTLIRERRVPRIWADQSLEGEKLHAEAACFRLLTKSGNRKARKLTREQSGLRTALA